MAWAYLVLYRIEPEDRVAFVMYYRDHHLPLVRAFPGLRAAELHIAEPNAPFLIVLRLVFDSRQDLETALQSPERLAAKADMEKFPAYRGEIVRFAAEISALPVKPAL